MLSSLFFALSSLSVAVFAGTEGFGGPCEADRYHLSFGNYELNGDCSAAFYCAANNTCASKGCRRDVYPFGYLGNMTLPPYCASGTFCPDEGDTCLPLVDVGQPCQLSRDDECQAAPDSSLTGPRNVNGAVCLDFVCMWANATLNNDCTIENMPYVVYDQEGGKEYVSIVSRDNCAPGLYCEGTKKQCLAQVDVGAACAADKQCSSLNCNTGGKCAMATDKTVHVATWVYIVIGVALIGSMLGVLVMLFFVHQKSRKIETEKRSQYWREQEAFRNNILSMREQARASQLSLPRGEPYRDNDFSGSETSRSPMLYSTTKSSGLRNNFADDNTDADSMEESLVPRNQQDDYDYNGNSRRGNPTGGRV